MFASYLQSSASHIFRPSQNHLQELSLRTLLLMPMYPDHAWMTPRQHLAHRVLCLGTGTTHLGLMTSRISSSLRSLVRRHFMMTVSLSAAVRHPVLGCFLPNRVSRPITSLAIFLLYLRRTLTAGLMGPNGAQLSVPESGMVLLKYRFGTFQTCPSPLLENSNYEPSGTFSTMEEKPGY